VRIWLDKTLYLSSCLTFTYPTSLCSVQILGPTWNFGYAQKVSQKLKSMVLEAIKVRKHSPKVKTQGRNMQENIMVRDGIPYSCSFLNKMGNLLEQLRKRKYVMNPCCDAKLCYLEK